MNESLGLREQSNNQRDRWHRKNTLSGGGGFFNFNFEQEFWNNNKPTSSTWTLERTDSIQTSYSLPALRTSLTVAFLCFVSAVKKEAKPHSIFNCLCRFKIMGDGINGLNQVRLTLGRCFWSIISMFFIDVLVDVPYSGNIDTHKKWEGRDQS